MISGVSRVGLRGVSKTRKFKWLVTVGASIVSTHWFKKNLGWGGFRATQKTLYMPMMMCERCVDAHSRLASSEATDITFYKVRTLQSHPLCYAQHLLSYGIMHLYFINNVKNTILNIYFPKLYFIRDKWKRLVIMNWCQCSLIASFFSRGKQT